jgi:hypothetical protein
MAVTITDRRTTVDDAEAVTNWTNVGYGTQSTDVAEQTNAVADGINIGNQSMYYTQPTGSVNLGTSPGTLVYVYSFNNAIQNVWNNTIPPQALLLGDGTNRIGFHMAGSDKRVFNHLEGPTTWQCLVLDTSQASTMNTNSLTYADAGSFASLNLGAVTQWGCYFETLSKALGGGYNVSTDIIRYGNDGIRITAGGVGTEGTCLELAAADRSTADGAAHGIFRELATVAFGCQGPLTFGDSGTATDSRFIDSGVTIVFEDRNIGNDKYYLNVEGNSGATNVFELSNATITTAGPFVTMDMSGGNIDTLTFDAVSFVALGNGITFSTLADASGHSVTACTFDGCGIVYPGDVTFDGCTFSNAADANGAVEWDAGVTVTNQDNLTFLSDGTGHAIYINIDTASASTFNIDGYLFDGYAGQDGTAGNRVFYINNPSDGDITINLSNCSAINQVGTGSGFSYELATGTTSTVSINQTVTLTVIVLDADGNPVEGARVRIEATSDGSQVTQGTTNASGVYTDGSYNYGGDLAVTTKVRLKGYKNFRTGGTISSTGISVGVTLQADRIVDLP